MSTTSSANDFSLKILPETYLGGEADGNFSLDSTQQGDETVVQVRVDNARELKALYFELEYDLVKFQPVGAAAVATLAQTGRLATLTALNTPGLVSHGQVTLHPDSAPGFAGSGVLAKIRFRSGPTRAAAQAHGEKSGSGQISWDPLTHTLSWYYYNLGDYDQNGEVNVADLTPLARHIKQRGPFTPFSIQEVVDGDSNGEINLADITPIGVNFKAAARSYRIYKSTDPNDAPTINDQPSTIPPVAEVLLDQAIGDRLSERLRFSYVLTDVEPGDYFWVRPFDGSGENGASGMAGGTNELRITLLSEPISGDGSEAFPYVLDPEEEYQFLVTHSVVGDVSTDPATNYTLDPSAAGTLTNEDAILRIAAEFEGDFTVSATFFDIQADPRFIYCFVDPEGGGNLNLPPTAALTASPSSGDPPLYVVLDASASTDSDGVITTYEWDFTSDGTYDENTGDIPTTATVYYEPGTYVARVRVTDDDGATDTAEQTISVGTSGWNVVDISTTGFDGGWPQLVDAGDAPGIVYCFESEDPETPFEVRYRRALDSTASTWTAPLAISPDSHDGTAVADAIPVDGNPAALYQANSDEGPGLFYVRAGDLLGGSWGEPRRIDRGTWWGGYSQLQGVAGNPAVVYINEGAMDTSISYIRAIDAQGNAWGTPQYLDITPEASSIVPSFDLIDGRAAIAYFDHYSGTVNLVQATDVVGNTWSDVRELLDAADGGYNPVLVAGAKLPTLIFEGSGAALRFMPATDMQASGFEEPQLVDDHVQHYVADYGPRMAWIGESGSEVPAIAYFKVGEVVDEVITTDVVYIQAADPQASSWLEPEVVFNAEDCFQIELTAIDGKPHLAWTDFKAAKVMYAGRNSS